MRFYLPKNLDLISLLKSRGLDKYCKPIHLAKFYYLIHLIYEQKVLYKNKDYVLLKASYLRYIIKEYNLFRDLLIDLKIIECDFFYIKNKKSYGYRILAPYNTVPTEIREINAKVISKKIKLWKEKRFPNTPVHNHLYSFLKKTSIDLEALNEVKKFSVEKQNIYKISIDKFINKEFFLYNDNYGRIHTNITTLKSIFRRFLLYNGTKLACIDIKNSQPLLLFLSFQEKVQRIRHDTILSKPKNIIYTKRCTFLDMTDDLRKYKETVEGGTLYEVMTEIVPGLDDRNDAKKYLFKEVFFGRNVCPYFRQAFPKISNYLINLKSKDYRRVSWVMQRLESKIIINYACGILLQRNPEMYLATIHDSILTTPDHVEEVKGVLLDVFSDYNVRPSFSIETY